MFGAEPSPPAGRTVRDGDVITVGVVSLSVIHTPGHSPGGICLYSKGVVFTGDTLFVGAVGRTDGGGGSWETLASSIRNKLYTLPDATLVLPGHNYGNTPKSTIGMEKPPTRMSPLVRSMRLSVTPAVKHLNTRRWLPQVSRMSEKNGLRRNTTKNIESWNAAPLYVICRICGEG